ncbi:MAG: group 1 glycosyl transferase [Thermoleophilia bacterium]|nr:group 1 glycosyl transferase [Thermoleophilia bacterium]
MRVLLVSYYFPPAGGGGVQRVLGWCRHLPSAGVEVTVVAPREPHWVDQDTTLVVPGDVQVLRTDDPSPAAVIPRAALADVSGARRIARRIALQPRRFAVPDIHRGWRRPAVRAVLEEARRRAAAGDPGWDVVVSSSPPETAHLVAHDVARALGIPWVADFRDSWLDLPHLRMGSPAVRLKHAANRRLATRVLARASAATTVSQPLADDLRRRHPALAVTVIENGVEVDAVGRAATRADGFRDVGRFVVTYTGNFFGLQSAASFLDAVERALTQEPSLEHDLLVRFVGGLKPAELARVTGPLAGRGVAEHVEFLRHDDVLAQQRASDLLLLYVAPGTGSAGVYTGKVFEYVAARRPVLALVPGDNVAGELLTRAGSVEAGGGTRVDPDDVDAISSALVAAWRAWRDADGPAGGRTPDIAVPDDVLRSIDRADGARRLADVLRDVAAGSTSI